MPELAQKKTKVNSPTPPMTSCHTSLADVSIRYSKKDAAVHLAEAPAKDSASKGLKVKANMAISHTTK